MTVFLYLLIAILLCIHNNELITNCKELTEGFLQITKNKKINDNYYDQNNSHNNIQKDLQGDKSIHQKSIAIDKRHGRKSRKLQQIPSLILPLGLKNQSREEKHYLKLHKCKDAGEVSHISFFC